jgi:Wiskott-Aldrich syndrome protein
MPNGGAAAVLPKAPVERVGLLADIRGGAKLRKVDDSVKRDRSAAAVPGAEPAAGSPAPTPGPDAGMAGALATALAQRKAKVANSGKLCLLLTYISSTNLYLQTMRMMAMTGEELNIIVICGTLC